MSEGRRSLKKPVHKPLARSRKSTVGTLPKKKLVVEIPSKKRKITQRQNDSTLQDRILILEARLKEADNVLKEKSAQLALKTEQLAAVDALYGTADSISIAEVVRSARDIMVRVQQISAQVAYFDFGTTKTKRYSVPRGRQTVEDPGEIIDIPGLHRALRVLKDVRDRRMAQMILQLLLQHCIIDIGLLSLMETWSHSKRVNNFCVNAYESLRGQERQVVARFWRSLTKKALKDSEDTPDGLKRLVQVVAGILAEVAGGSSIRKMMFAVRAEFEDDLRALWEMMVVFHDNVMLGVKSKELKLFFPSPQDLFDERTMENEEVEKAHEQEEVFVERKVFLITGFGIYEETAGKAEEFLLKARVHTESTFREELAEVGLTAELSEIDFE
ncbi:hypothetical protein V5O48_010312 [Marasmius crinis-equi]|uniref:Uncharacterized protein n=1 Tax=Marasmius crinis-equi TaxID=585013 RepID=A0ABR3F968_9AGAR